jgi:uncharacterized protein (DUF1697 family)
MEVRMQASVAFLRGINVGGNKQIKMDALRAAFAGMGYQRVQTLLASGNVLFEAEEQEAGVLTAAIEAGLEKAFGTSIGVLLRSREQIRALAAADPFAGVAVTKDTRLYVSFLSVPPKDDTLTGYVSPGGEFRILRVSPGEVCSVLTLSPEMRTTEAMNVLEKTFGKKITTRNWNTIEKVLQAWNA